MLDFEELEISLQKQIIEGTSNNQLSRTLF